MHLPWRQERRRPGRSPEPMCPQCQTALVGVTVRTSEVVSYRCKACDETWNVPKPAVPGDDATPGAHSEPDGSTSVISSAQTASALPQTTMQRAKTLIESVSDEGRGRKGPNT